MIGQKVEVPTGIAAWTEGVVVDYDETTGTIVVETEDGEKIKGCESLAVNI